MEAIKTIYLDSSGIAKLAEDACSTNSIALSKAKEFIADVHRCGYVLFFSTHHIYELLAHGSNSVVDSRIRLISRLPIVAWSRGYDDGSQLGGYPDVHAFEASVAVRNEKECWIKKREILRTKIVEFGTGKVFSETLVAPMLIIREMGLLDGANTREVESIIHTAESEFNELTIDELCESTFKTPEAIRDFYSNYALSVQRRLSLRGDKKMEDTANAARKFAEMARIDPDRVFKNGVFDLQDFLKDNGVRLEQVDGNTTAREVGQLGVFNRQIDLLVERSVINENEALMLKPHQFPSWLVRLELDRATKTEKIAKGSSLVDRHHAAFAPYVDLFQGDKRTRHYIGQFKDEAGPLKSAKDALISVVGYTDVLSPEAYS